MKILFVSTNRNKHVMPPMPLGLASVMGQIDESRHDIKVLDLMFAKEPEQDLASVLSDFAPDIVAFSIRNLDNQSFFNTVFFLPEDKKYVALCREKSSALIIAGGPAFTVSPEAVFEYLEPDFGIAGEGELAFKDLMDRIEDKKDWSDLPGLVWRTKGVITMNPFEHIKELDSLKFPRRDLFDHVLYGAASRGMGNILIKQGCEFRCLYCDSPHVLGPKWRKKSPERVVAELEEMKNAHGIKIAYFTDAVFNAPASHAESICRAILDKGLKIQWIATLHPAGLTETFLSLIRQAGCVAVSVSCDACSEPMLKALNKGFTMKDLSRATRLLEDMKLPYMLSLLLGGPGEDRKTVEASMAFLRQSNPMLVDICAGIRLMPHSELFKLAVKEGIVQENDPLMEPKFYISPAIKDWIREYLITECRDHKNWSFTHGEDEK
jgi:radical SAM superfamily enzyme YgiQ (UPF0313 family)